MSATELGSEKSGEPGPVGAGLTAGAVNIEQVARGGALFLAARVGTQAIQLVVTLMVARILQPADYGLMAAAGLVGGFAELLALAGLGRALVHTERISSAHIDQTFTLLLCLCMSFFGIVNLLAGPIAAHVASPQFETLLRVLSISLLIVPFQAVSMALIERKLQFGRITIVTTVVGLVQCALIVILALAGFGVWALGLSTLAATVMTTMWLFLSAGWRPRLALPTLAIKPLLLYGVTVAAASVLWFIYRYADLAVITLLLDPTRLGYYWLALQIVSLPLEKLTTAVNQIAFPAYCRMQEDLPRMHRWFGRTLQQISLMTMPTLTGLALIAEDAVPLALGEQWRDAVLPLQILAPFGITAALSATFPPLFNAQGRPEISLRFTGVSAAVLPVAFLIGGYFGGIIGVCLAWLLFYPILLAGLVYTTTNLTSLSLGRLLGLHVPVLISLAGMTVTVLVARHLLADAGVGMRIVLEIAAGGLVYTGLILLTARSTIVADLIYVVRTLGNRGEKAAG